MVSVTSIHTTQTHLTIAKISCMVVEKVLPFAGGVVASDCVLLGCDGHTVQTPASCGNVLRIKILISVVFHIKFVLCTLLVCDVI